jgi:hypothetical protein
MNISRIYGLLSSRVIATLSIITLTLLTIKLSSLDTSISSEREGVFALFTSFTPDRFKGVVSTWGITGLEYFGQYLLLDIVFAFCCLIAFPSIIGLMFTQFSLLKTEIAHENVPQVHYRVRNIFLSLIVMAVASNITSDVILMRVVNSGIAPTSAIFISAVLQSFKMAVYVATLCYIVFLLLMRRKLIRKA